jgi:TetR/AcrR family transcriptional repressor of mexJK operon
MEALARANDIDGPAESKRLAARRKAFLAAAADVFLEKGFSDTTLDDVIARSRGSRQTLYALFGSKQGLFEALLSERCSLVFAGTTLEQMLERDPEDVLVELGTALVSVITSPDGVGLFRLLIAEAPRVPELAQHFWSLGPGRNRALLGDYFARLNEQGRLAVPDPKLAGDQFWDMLYGTPLLKALFGLCKPMTRPEIEQRVRAAVTQFLSGFRVRQPAAPVGH